MKILMLGPAHPLRGGIAAFNERLARAFMEEGHDVEMISFRFQYPSFLFPGTSQYSNAPAPSHLSIQSTVHSLNPFNWFSVGKQIRDKAPDILIVRFWIPLMAPCLGTILRIVRKNRKTKIICIADNIIPHEKRWGDRLLTRYFIKPIDAFITMSETVLHDLRSFTQKPALLEPHPLYDHFGASIPQHDARVKLGIDTNKFVFLFFGFIRKYKGLDLLLEAIAILKRKGINEFRVLVAGEFYEDRKAYDSLIDALDLQQMLILKTHFIADDDLRNYFCAADAVVQPYRSATQSGVTPLAYHFEKPMIVTNVGGLPAMVQHGQNGLVCAPEPEAIALAMSEMLDCGAEQFIPSLRIEKAKYGWDKMTTAVIQLAGQ